MNEGLEYVLGHKDMCGQKKDEEQGEAEIVEEEEVAKQALNLARGISLPMVLKSAIELNLLEIISAAGDGAWLSPSEIASQLPTKNPSAAAMLDRMLRLLAGFSIVKCKLRPAGGEDEDGRVDYGERVYGMAPVCKFLTENKEGQGSIGPLLMLHHDKVFMESWHVPYHLTDAVLEGGIPFNRAYGMNSFEYMGMNQSFNQLFNRAMSSHTALIVRKIVGAYRGFAGLRGVLVDVGGGSGVTLNIITSKYPNIKGINYDLPHVLKDAPVYPGVEHVSGDMFETVPTGDAIFMKWILHDWSDEWCLKLLKNCHRALPDSGVVIAVESILSGAPDGELTSVIPYEQDLGMLAHNPGGKERTRHEFEALARESGFSRCEVTCCVYNSWVIEFHK